MLQTCDCKKHPERSEGSLSPANLIRVQNSQKPSRTFELVRLPHSARKLQHAATLSIVILVLLLTSCRSPGVTVQIVNQTPTAIRTVEVVYPGGSYGIAHLARGGSHAKWIAPTSDGLLKISYIDASGQSHNLEKVTLKRGYAGGLAVVLLPQDQVKLEDQTHPRK